VKVARPVDPRETVCEIGRSPLVAIPMIPAVQPGRRCTGGAIRRGGAVPAARPVTCARVAATTEEVPSAVIAAARASTADLVIGPTTMS
jgi:hypothetical protein